MTWNHSKNIGEGSDHIKLRCKREPSKPKRKWWIIEFVKNRWGLIAFVIVFYYSWIHIDSIEHEYSGVCVNAYTLASKYGEPVDYAVFRLDDGSVERREVQIAESYRVGTRYYFTYTEWKWRDTSINYLGLY